MKRICIVYLGRKGAGPVDTLEMCKQMLLKSNFVYIVLSIYIENIESFKKLQSENENNCIINFVKTYNNKCEFLFRTLNIFRFIKLSKAIKKQNVDFIYYPMITLWSAILSFYINKNKLNVAVHDPESHLGEVNFINDFIFNSCAKRAKYITVFSNKFINVVCSKFKKNPENVCLLRLSGYDYYNTKQPEFLKERHNRVLFFGRIVEYKGLYYLLEATKKIILQYPNFVLRIVGNGELTEKEKQLVDELKSNIEITNRWIKDEEVTSFFDSVDFVVLPYVEATQSGIVMLSYAMGKGILSTNVGAIDEQVLPSTGILVPPKDIDSLVDGIKRMYENDIFMEMGKKGFNLVTTEWTFEVQAQKLINFMEM